MVPPEGGRQAWPGRMLLLLLAYCGIINVDEGEGMKMAGSRFNSVYMTELRKEMERLGEKEFARLHSHPYLVVVSTPPSEFDDDDESTVRTVHSGKFQLAELAQPPSKQVIPVVLSGRGRLRDKVVLGRLDSCDIIIRASKISRQHAAFFEKRRSWWLEDQGSANGTRLNGTRLEPGQPAKLKSGDMVAMWKFLFQFVEAEPFRVMLRAMS